VRTVKFSELVLGAFVPPPSMPGLRPDGRHRWIEATLRVHVERAVAGQSARPLPPFAWERGDADFPALHRFSLSHPAALAQTPPPLGLRPFSRIVEAEKSGKGPGRLVAPDPGGVLRRPEKLAWHDTSSGLREGITTDPAELDAVLVESLRTKAVAWVRPTPKDVPEAVIVDELLSATPEDTGLDVAAKELLVAAPELGAAVLAGLTDLPERLCRHLAAGRPPRPATVLRALAGLTRHLGPDPLPRLLDLVAAATPRVCGVPGCGEPARPRSRTCSEADRKALSRTKAGAT